MERKLSVRRSFNYFVVCIIADGEILPLNDSVCRRFGIEPLPDKGALTYAASKREDAMRIAQTIIDNLKK